VIQSDAEIVQEVLDGRKEAYAELVRRYEQAAKAMAMNILQDFHQVEDAAQEAFVKAYEKLATLKNPAAFGPWLMRTTRRCALDLLKQRKRNMPLNPLPAIYSHQKNGQLEDDKRLLLQQINKLPDHEQQVILLRYFGQKKVSEIAAILQRKINTITVQLSRAHRRLRENIQELEP